MSQASVVYRFWPLIARFVLGATLLLWFFASMFNGLDGQVVAAAIATTGFNGVASALVARRSLAEACLGATVFASPALLPATLGLGDLFVNGRSGPLLFWLATGLVTAAVGLAGAWLGGRRRPRH